MSDVILDGARSIFCRKGIANGSLEEIAAGLGISKHTIYRRYPGKNALLEAVVDRDIRRFQDALSQAASEGTDELDAVRRTALRYFEFGTSRDYAGFYLSVSAEAVFSSALRERLAAWSEFALAPLIRTIRAAQEAGFIRPGDPGAMGDILVDLLEGANNRVRLREASDVGPSMSDTLFDQRWAVFQAALGVPPSDSEPGGITGRNW